jgi:hypothetical protein
VRNVRHLVSRGWLVGLASGFALGTSGCGTGKPAGGLHVIEAPEVVRQREQALQDAMRRGFYGKVPAGMSRR